VRYKPGEAIRWLQTEAGRLKSDAKASGRAAAESSSVDMHGITETVKNAASAVFNMGRSAYAEMAHLRANASEFVLLEDRLDIVSGSSIKAIPYSSVKKITLKGDKAQLILEKGTYVIKPFAYVVAGPLKVPIGWERNGLETPYLLIIEELAARCQKEVELI
jgi:hypothetical protein